MNGGFSVRDRNLMIELSKFKNKIGDDKIIGYDNDIFYEDVYFTNLIRENYSNLLPNIKACNEFAIESEGDYTKAIGIHGTDKYYANSDFYKKVFKYLEDKKK